MRHFGYLADDDRARLFARIPEEFGIDDDPEQVGVGLGATLYCPATRPHLADDVRRRAAQGVVSVVLCLEDSVADTDVADAEVNLVRQLRRLAGDPASLPLIFVRVRAVDQIGRVVRALGDATAVLSGVVVPKFRAGNGRAYAEAVVAAGTAAGHRLLLMPVLETGDLSHLETRAEALVATRRIVDKYREYVPAVRLGATDLSAAFGLRRPRDFTVWDLRVVADVLGSVVNVFGRVDDGSYVISGAVWEYFNDTERLFKPLLRETPFGTARERALRAELIAKDLDGLIREVVLDRANGLIGKTVIHPSHVAAVHALSVVSAEEYADAVDVLATRGRGGATASSFGNKMNESKPHTAWARRTVMRARAFGVAREGVSFVDLLAAGLHT